MDKIKRFRNLGLASFTTLSPSVNVANSTKGINIMLIVADYMNYDVVGAFGSPVPGTAPILII